MDGAGKVALDSVIRVQRVEVVHNQILLEWLADGVKAEVLQLAKGLMDYLFLAVLLGLAVAMVVEFGKGKPQLVHGRGIGDNVN